MKKIEWSPAFSMGIASIDDQHKQMTDMINILISHSNASVHDKIITELLTKLNSYAKKHFNEEEHLLEKYGYRYTDLTQHKEEHDVFRQNIAHFCKDTTDLKDSVPGDLLLYISEWWKHHILVTDMKYRAFLVEHVIE